MTKKEENVWRICSGYMTHNRKLNAAFDEKYDGQNNTQKWETDVPA